ncbi:parallel beta-helix repeat (two copies) [Paenibacillus tianmuensis]|uniref:Parallel beta-helix repeat (Two copies) n=1 Tax=Paenibacillus tianmuensis TaxID=624147 RepID=A0A1G4RJZ4_9BACL|nr:NosD domain-containing protein [Paenibacillus tianmuensis]SCW57138.1 parallel beta-helix repeat (two copies) [Paenibacillus tianmuensis]
MPGTIVIRLGESAVLENIFVEMPTNPDTFRNFIYLGSNSRVIYSYIANVNEVSVSSNALVTCSYISNVKAVDVYSSSLVTGNRFEFSKINVHGDDSLITNNTIRNHTDGGIEVRFGSNNLIQGNMIRKGTSSPEYGIMINSGDGNFVINNDLKDSGKTAFSDQGRGTITTAGNRT